MYPLANLRELGVIPDRSQLGLARKLERSLVCLGPMRLIQTANSQRSVFTRRWSHLTPTFSHENGNVLILLGEYEQIPRGIGLMVGTGAVHFSAHHSAHAWAATITLNGEEDLTYLTLDHKVLGLGSASCGPRQLRSFCRAQVLHVATPFEAATGALSNLPPGQ